MLNTLAQDSVLKQMTEQLSKSEILHYTNLWCKQRGFKSRDLQDHPWADDIVALRIIFDEFGQFMDKGCFNVWNGLWSMVYTQQYPLKAKHISQLEGIVKAAELAKNKKTIKIQKIKKLRQTAS